MIEKEFIKSLLEKSKEFIDDIFIPKEFEININEIENFNIVIVERLSQIEETVFIETINNPSGTISREYKTLLVKYDTKKNVLKFYPVALKNYLKKIENEEIN